MLNKLLNKNRIYIVVTYDINYTKVRNKIVSLLEQFGFRVQKSVFELFLYEDQYVKLKKQLNYQLIVADKYYQKENLENNDNIRFYILSKKGLGFLEGKVQGLGKGFISEGFKEVFIK